MSKMLSTSTKSWMQIQETVIFLNSSNVARQRNANIWVIVPKLPVAPQVAKKPKIWDPRPWTSSFVKRKGVPSHTPLISLWSVITDHSTRKWSHSPADFVPKVLPRKSTSSNTWILTPTATPTLARFVCKNSNRDQDYLNTFTRATVSTLMLILIKLLSSLSLTLVKSKMCIWLTHVPCNSLLNLKPTGKISSSFLYLPCSVILLKRMRQETSKIESFTASYLKLILLLKSNTQIFSKFSRTNSKNDYKIMAHV